MSRPLIQHGVGELEALFVQSKSDLKVLKQLEDELKYRKVPRAVALLEEVQVAMSGATLVSASVPPPAQPPAKVAAPTPQQSNFWQRALEAPVSVLPGGPQPTSAAPVIKQPQAPAAPTPVPPPAPAMPLQDAYKVLKATPGSKWEAIEQTRRELVQQSYLGCSSP